MQATEEHVAVNEGAKVLPPETPTDSKNANDRTEIIDGGMVGSDRINLQPGSPHHKEELLKIGSSVPDLDTNKKQKGFTLEPAVNGISMSARESLAISGQSGEANAGAVIPPSAKSVS